MASLPIPYPPLQEAARIPLYISPNRFLYFYSYEQLHDLNPPNLDQVHPSLGLGKALRIMLYR